MDKRIERILPLVQKPARYTGGEYGEIHKDLSDVELRMALCFPDVYEIGMSNTGMRILYRVLNDMPGVWCERVFAPWFDMRDEMRRNALPLWALESGDTLDRFDAVGFSIGYEMAYTTVLEMLSLSGLPLRSRDRESLTPMIFAGGSACCNGEPMAEFFDLMVVGEGEDVDREVLELLRRAKREAWTKSEFLREASRIGGVYVPSLYEPEYNGDGTLASVSARQGAPERVTKRIIEDFENSCFPADAIVPNTEIVHDRVGLELFRGCIRGCRFCQAGHIYRPVRARSVNKLLAQGKEALARSGYQEITLLSLSTSDYRGLNDLCDGLLEYCEPRGIGLSLPSLRADNFSMEITERVQKVRRSGLTFAPEAGTQRLRDVINKNVTEEELLRSCAAAFRGGWNGIKLYFMLGLPTETDEDVLGIAELADRVVHCWRENASNKARGLRVTVSTSCFVPKPHTPFQWEPQVTREEYLRRVNLLRDNMKARAVTYNWHDAE
ncbi:MAG: TIGR03960 family B12-binding radical SAM protein, partial [Oscillospiraceae bacterium]|nr:TIGR03960 family B12-binding radical SAM protein [Oscillospiraceae bacterium]